MKKTLTFTLAVLFLSLFLFLGFFQQNQAKAVDNPTPNPSILGTLSNTNDPKSTYVAVSTAKNLAIACGTSRGTDIIDISNPASPQILSSIFNGEISVDAVFVGDLAYIVSAGILRVVNIADPAHPQLITEIRPTGYGFITHIAASGDIAVILDGMPPYAQWLKVLDISDPASPGQIGEYFLGGGGPAYEFQVELQDNLAFLTSFYLDTLQIINLNISRDPTPQSNPILRSKITIVDARDTSVSGNTVYVSANNGGIKLVDISNPDMPIIRSTFSTNAIVSSIAGNILAVLKRFDSGGGNFKNKIELVDVSNLDNPQKKAEIESIGSADSVMAANNKLYVADSAAELVIMDIFHDTPTFLKTADKYEVNSGDEVIYTITLTNSSPNTLTNFNMTDIVPSGTTYISSSGAFRAGVIRWKYTSISPSQIITETFKVRVN